MCRFLAYNGPPTLMQHLLLDSSHSLVSQSRHASMRFEPVNGDGFGVGWYSTHDDPLPGIFTGIEPAWSNRNLREVASKIYTAHFFAHVRDASKGMPVSQANCHPFKCGPYLWMHNGHLSRFEKCRRRLLASLSDPSFAMIRGNTDSEHAFALFMDALEHNDDADGQQMYEALLETLAHIIELKREGGCEGATRMNFAVSNGSAAVFTRFTAGEAEPPSLFYQEGEACIVASEPLSETGRWTAVEAGQALLVHQDALEIKTIPPGL